MPVITPEKNCGLRLTEEMLTQAQSPLQELDWRLLRWLLRYPLQRADDLVVGVASWASRATVYRHLQALEANTFVESVLPKTLGEGKRLYHLSNLGLHVLARHLERPARELAQQWQTDETGLLHRLPRLPSLLLLQNVVNGLIMGASEAMTAQGRRPQLVRWTWQSDVVHRFQYREQAMRVFVDGVVALCIHAPQRDGTVLDQWYGLFLLSTLLDDERLMHLRLERLLCWRESPERWSSYQHMLPVLILAATSRQAEHWQHAVEISALKLRLDPLRGAMACLAQVQSGEVNPWRLAWHTLSSNQSCHLHDLLRAVPPTVLTPFLDVGEGEEETHHARTSLHASDLSGPTKRHTRLVVGSLARRAASITQHDLEEREVIALLGLRLTPCHWNIVRLLLAHPLLSDEELAGLLSMERKSVRSSLSTLRALGCLGPISTSAGKRWHLYESGMRLIAGTNHFSLRNIAIWSDNETTSTLVQRGEGWLLQNIQHTAGIYGFFATLAQAARRVPGQGLCWWETGAACERRYRVGEHWHNLRPDALAEYCVGERPLRFWLEWDRGTMNVRDLAIKFASYAHYFISREWAREFPRVPLLVCIVPDVGQEKRIHRVAQERLAHLPGVEVWMTTEGLINRSGLLASIWVRCLPTLCQAMQPDDLGRHLLFDAIAGKTAE